MKQKYLPVGSVVLLKGGTKKIMINGYCVVTEKDPDKMYDYRGCPFPEGILGDRGAALFNIDQIEEVCFEGWKSDDSIDFLDRLEILVEKEKEKNS